MNYYNEFDPKAAAWLRELIDTGAIPAGHVDERSIEDVVECPDCRSRASAGHMVHVAEKNLRNYVSRHVPAGPDRESALNCINVLAARPEPTR